MAIASLVSRVKCHYALVLAIFVLTGLVAVAQGKPTVYYMSPRLGSLHGATRITISGNDFSKDPFAYGEGNEDKGNKVYLKNDTASIECDVLAYWSNSQKIVCDTRAAAPGTYTLLLYVDGEEVAASGGSYCSRSYRCRFSYQDNRTPYVHTVTPQSGTPKSKVNIYGRIYTDLYTENQESVSDVEDHDDDPTIIQRVYWGDYFCDLIDPETDQPYRLELNNDGASSWGNMQVVPQGTYVGSQKLVFLTSGQYGRSKPHAGSLRMSGQNKVYHYQTHAEINSIEPSVGSLEGGTLLTISGNYFDAHSDTVVLVGGVQCDIQNISDTEILCITNKAPDSTYNTYPGSRGMLYERWSSQAGLGSAAFDVESSDFAEQRIVLESVSPFDVAGNFYGRLRGYFVPPRDGRYRFWVRGDDVSELYISDTGDETNMTKTAYSTSYTPNWFSKSTQRGEKLDLEGGKPYYLEARYKEYGGGDHVYIGVDFFDIDVEPGLMSGVYGEEQTISIASQIQQERQVIEVINTLEMQEIHVNYLGCNDTELEMDDCEPMEYFYITYDGQTTAEIGVFANPEEVEDELNEADIFPENVTAYVGLEIINGVNYTYTITFDSEEDMDKLIVQTNDPFIVDLDVVELHNPRAAADSSFALDFGGVQSELLSTTSTAEEVKEAIEDMFTVQCNKVGGGNPTFTQDFEGEIVGGETGTRVINSTPLCGRVALKNPTWIYQEGETQKADGSSVNPFRSDFTNMLCFGFKGKISSQIHITLRYIDNEFQQVYNGEWFTSEDLAEYNGYSASWEQVCIDLNELVTTQGEIRNDVYGNTGMFVTKIEFPTPDANNPLYIDNIYIGDRQSSYTRTRTAASPNDIRVTDIMVNKTDLGFDITMWAANCGHGFPLLNFEESNIVSEADNDSVIFTSSSFTSTTWMQVRRVTEATVPISGTFVLESDGKSKEVSATASAEQLRDILESFLDTGIVHVHKTSDCYSTEYEIEWISKGGSQPLLEVNTTGLTGTNVSAEVERVSEGRFFMGPIPGEFLRLPYNTSQVEVMVNHIASICGVNGTCSFSYDADATPEVDSISPSSGSEYEGTTITISGSGFSSDPAENNVTIGGEPCYVTSASEDELECDIGQGPAGTFDLLLHVEGKGLAAYPNGAVEFEYDGDILDVDPENGSTAGGTQITISGYGFPCDSNAHERVMVAVGDKSCKIISVCYEEIACKITMGSSNSRRRRSADSADIVVTIDGNIAAEANGIYNFDNSLTPSVSSYTPDSSAVSGGENLTISGSGFESDGATVDIGDAECIVLSQSDTEIVCELPPNNAGSYYLEVTVLNKGFADVSSVDQFQYGLKVTSMTPDIGSLEGGTIVTITGEGFGDDASDVSIEFSDRITCEIESITDTEIVCVIEIEPVVHTVDNLGRHETWGRGYKWNPQLADICVGDIVHWTWTVPTFVNGMSYTVQQTADADSTAYDGSGFYAGSMSTQGSYAFKFSAPGTFYYSSGPVNGGDLILKGVVQVGPPESQALKLSLYVGDTEAEYDTDSGVTPSSSGCSASTDPNADCDTSTQPTSDDADTFSFAFWDCYTPAITDISPNTGPPDTVITLTGYGFGTQTCQNEVLINGHNCIVQSASSTEIECEIDRNNTFPVGNYYSVNMNVLGKGTALNSVMSPIGRIFKMYPAITSLSPTQGSTEGGTRVVISGDGFSASSVDDVDVSIGGAECKVESVEYTEITCITTNSDTRGAFEPVITINNAEATCESNSGCDYTFAWATTPKVTDVSPTVVSGASTTITVSGSGFSSDTSEVTVTVGGVDCDVTSASEDSIDCDVAYVPVGNAPFVVNIDGSGNSNFNNSNHALLWSNEVVDSIDPASGSIEGGQEITIVGSGFREGDTTVDIGGSDCEIQTLTLSQIVCISSSHSAETVELIITSGGLDYDAQSYEYSDSDTPTVSSVSPTSGVSGDSISISGSGFSSTDSENTVTINGVECEVTSSSSSSIDCDVGVHSAGTYTVQVHVEDKGYATSSTDFEYSLAISSASPDRGSFAGGPTLEIQGAGFGTTDDTTVTICDNVCEILNITIEHIECDIPRNSGEGSTEDCDIVVTLDSGATATESNGWQYREDLTPIIDMIDPIRGGTGGGTTLTITGSGFESSGNEVTIAGTTCAIISESQTEIECRTGAHSPSIQSTIRVDVPNKGVAVRENASYYYVDVWSSRYTWGGLDPPIEGDFVIVPEGQTLLMDTSTPILKMLLIQGGKVIFDEVDMTLNAEYILIMDDGLLQVGTEDEPFQHQATIMMHGHTRSKELPMYGAKVLAVRHGTLDLHGKVVPVTWTYLADTISAGDTEMTLKVPVTWEIGDQIVIASTGHRHAQRENEELTITGVSDDGLTLTFEPAVEYEHISVEQVIDGVLLETRAEVGLLTRNVVVRGSVHSEWTETIEACDAEFDTNQFATQTCFQGKFGEETASDQYGSSIFMFAREPDKHLSTGRLSNVEVTHAGQAFRLGRYAIHYHLNGNVTGNYVRSCAIHHTFNRAITIHAVHHLLVEHNVAYNIMGHAYFTEDGIETKNIIQYNLAIFVRSSSSLLNVDVTPAAYWLTNADNIVRHNNAAGGSHFGFWYRAPVHPEGPSFTNQICPRNVPVLEFYNNTVHTQGWYGIWIFPVYYPMKDGACDATESAPSEYHNLTAWNVERGAEGVEVGNVRFIGHLISDATAAGLEYQTSWDAWGGPMIKDSVIIARSDISHGGCTGAGVQLPKSRHLTVDGVKFINFDQDGCNAIRACGHCKSDQGGFESRFQNIEFVNSPNKAAWNWEHEAWLEDLDGTLSGEGPNYSVLPFNPNLPPDHCTTYTDTFGDSGKPGAVCDDTITFHRFAFNNVFPSSLLYKRTIFINDHGASFINYHKKRLTHKPGWMVTLVDSENYRFIFEDRDHLTNISYNGRFDTFSDGEYLFMHHNFTQRPDAFALTGEIRNGSEQALTYENNNNADWHFDNDTRIFTYIISGKGQSDPVDRSVDLDVFRCYYKDCIPPVPEPPPELPEFNNTDSRPDNVLLWSAAETWESQPEGWGSNTGDGSYTGALPQNGEDVMILPGTYVVADADLPVMKRLFIYGSLELDDTRDYNLTATYILIQGGHLIIGRENQPFTHNVNINLQGDHFTPDIPLPAGPNLGSKALGSFGAMDLHGKNHSVYWTHLATTVAAGDNTLTVTEDTDWEEGDEIMVTATSYEPWHTETFTITEVTDERTFVLNATFQHGHSSGENTVTDGEVTWTYGLKADVGLLTRNIKIEGNDYDLLFEESFGARVIVGRFFQDGEMYQGFARISNVEFYHTGQEGWTDFYDPRYSLAFLDTGPSTEASPSYVTGCSFHSGFSPAIGIFGASDVLIKDNVIHHTVGSGIIDYGVGTNIIGNVIAITINPGTYQDRNEAENLDTFGGIDVRKATNPVLINNTVAGSEKFGFAIKGEVCEGETSWYGNTVHSTWMGVSLFLTNQRGCSKVANFEIYKCRNYGIYAQISSALLVTDVKMADNNVAILPLITGPAALSHRTSEKFVRVQDSLIVAVSPQYDCGGDDDITPEAASISRNHPAPNGPIALLWTTFMSSSNGAPFFPYHTIMSYPAVSGVNFIDNVMFNNFQRTCGKSPKVIRTNPLSIDMNHPIHMSNIQLVDVDEQFKIHYNRPPLGAVNPSDCVDMDCDGMKKAMIRDLDGSFLGSVGTVIPQSEFEWDGDPRRGLGDYRIPPVMVTNIDGSRIAYEDKLPEKGIYRGDNNECTWKSDWTAYECHGIDHMNMVIESLDADTEVRRVSPIALYSDPYVDLINGPQDNGWCHGYTCQERISTFYAIVATGKSYEMVFSGTNPQRIRYHLLNAEETQKVVIGTWYANPQRLDVYVNGIYILPNNGAIENGEFVWKNDLAYDDYKPLPTSDVYGENFFHRDEATLYINIKGSFPVDVVTTPVVMVTFGVPAVVVDDFFEENLINNLVQFLDIEPAQIRIVEIIAEDSKRRRRAAGEMEVVFEIGDPPASSIEVETSTGTPGPTTESVMTTPGGTVGTQESGISQTSSALDFSALTEIQSTLANEMQTGSLGESLDVQITSMAMTDPAETPVDPTGGERATNTSGGETNGTQTYAEQQAEAEAEEQANSNADVAVVYRIPTTLIFDTQPDGAVNGETFTTQPKIKVVDALGIIVETLGTKTHPWQLTATIRTGNGNLVSNVNVTQPFVDGWVNFTSLAIDGANIGYVLDFNVTFPNTSSLAVVSQSFDVTDRPYYAEVVMGPDDVEVNETFDVEIDIKDEISQTIVTDLADKSYVWHAVASISNPALYNGQLVGDTDVTVDLDTARALFTNLSINAAGSQYVLKVQVTTDPSSFYEFNVELDPFDVVDPEVVVHTGDAVRLTITFDADFDSIVAGREDEFEISFINEMAPKYPDVTITNVQASQGSIIVAFDIQGDTDGVQDLIYNDLQAGNVALTFNGNTLVASSSLLVDGEEQFEDGDGGGDGSDDDDDSKTGSAFPIMIVIIAVVVVVILVIVIVVLTCLFKKKQHKVSHFESESIPLHTQEKESLAFVNRMCTPDVVINDGQSSSDGSEPELQRLNEDNNTTRDVDLSMKSKCSTPNTPRRTPEVQVVTALPPGFSEEQEEKILEDRQRMYLMAKNTDGTFLKLGTLAVNLVGTVYQLRQDIINILSVDLQDKKFVMMKETLKDIEGSLEKKLSVSEVYSSDCVLIRFLNENDESKTCVCGIVGQFNCSLCHKQAYCSAQCQSKDWPRHTVICSNWNKEQQNLRRRSSILQDIERT